ncbi:hypothetical protein LCGC14_2672340 [marine sediment metagenome]|uniref:Uncharacterized protein n=1 Tax=marine sediment metagenome TaxID=412755 RepID=A0A0F9CFQ0_9ZZZZ
MAIQNIYKIVIKEKGKAVIYSTLYGLAVSMEDAMMAALAFEKHEVSNQQDEYDFVISYAGMIGVKSFD